jgi:D-alanyl-D-alanine dipeptidase
MGTAQRSATETSRKALSGAQWVNRFRGSSSLRDLKRSFKDKADAFIDALRAAGARVSISATYRPSERAYLMHWSWLIVKRDLDPANVPAMDGVDINWMHEGPDGTYSRAASVAAAREMVNGFNMQSLGVAPALQSRHTAGCGIDMTIRWTGTLAIADSDDNIVKIESFPHSGMNTQLHLVGASYGVIKFNRAGRDEPHWSDNGA